VAGGSWCNKTEAYAKFGEFSGILVEFLEGLGPNCNYFQI
jgi:hypothetical protein